MLRSILVTGATITRLMTERILMIEDDAALAQLVGERDVWT